MSNTKPSAALALASILLLGLGALATVQGQAGDEDSASEEFPLNAEGAGFFAIGANITNLGPLNDRLSAAGYPTFASGISRLGEADTALPAAGFSLVGKDTASSLQTRAIRVGRSL